MMDKTNSFIKQEDNSCGIAITGLSFNQCYAHNKNDLNQSLIQLAKAVLVDDSTVEKNLCLVIGNCSNADLISTEQLFSSIDHKGQGLSQQISNPLQGLEIAIAQLQHAISNTVVLILCDPLKNISTTQKAYYLSAFVLRPLADAVQYKKKIYASILHLMRLNNNDQLAQLKEKYQNSQISTSSINLFVLNSKPKNAIGQIDKLSHWFIESAKSSELVNKTNAPDIFHGEPWCSLQTDLGNDNNHSANGLTSLVETITSIQQRTYLPLEKTELIDQIELKDSPFYFNLSIRPWFHPQIHSHFRNMSAQPNYDSSQRRAAFHSIEQNGSIYHLILEEFEDANELKHTNLQSDWPSEIFTFFAENHYQLLNQLQSFESLVFKNLDQINLKDLSFTINSNSLRRINEFLSTADEISQQKSIEHIRVAFVCVDIEDFISKLKRTINMCLSDDFRQKNKDDYFESNDIYWSNKSYASTENERYKLAFILPGLGAAYPNMLAELCLHFPEIRAIFDFVDYLSISGGSKLRPSDRIFCRLDPRTKTFRETPASLAVMDSAVVTVLMAEWAIFTLLLNLDIVPDILLGSSTGEFAALTMSGAVDLFKAAPLFYHLSTGMVHALPMDQLISLRSLRVNDAYEKIEAELANYQNKVYLSANLSPKQLILTGDRESINTLLKSLESQNISADFLPFAIPYHTSLVANVVSANDPDIEALQISNPLIESWSCSLAAPYPSKADKIRKMTTDLFSKPILFRESIEALYTKGVRNFIEVGPRGNLAPIITEILQSRPHVSLAANRSDLSAITQLQKVLAVLYVNNIYMDLSYLFARRAPKSLALVQKQFEPLANVQSSKSNNRPNEPLVNLKELEPNIMAITRSFQKQLQDLEKEVMSYLVSKEKSSQERVNTGQYLSGEISLNQIFTGFSESNDVVCRRLFEENLPTDNDVLISLAEQVLTPIELDQLRSFNQIAKRKQWLAGRIVAKEAVRSLMAKTGTQINNTNIEIGIMDSGKPYVAEINATTLGSRKPVISITHKGGEIIAVAADSSSFSSIGIDLESKLLEDDIEDLILNSTERNYIQHLAGTERSLGVKKIWSAKESVAKVLGLGLPECLRKLSVIDVDDNTGKYRVITTSNVGHNDTYHNEYIAHVSCLDKAILSLAMA